MENWERATRYLEGELRSERWKVGEPFPAGEDLERECGLDNSYQVSKALAPLVRAGYLRTRQGARTRVVNLPPSRPVSTEPLDVAIRLIVQAEDHTRLALESYAAAREVLERLNDPFADL